MTTAVVTGGTRGIGAEIARRLAEGGHRTIALARSVPPSETANVEVIRCDVTDADEVERVFDQIGPVDILVNNAGVSSSDPLTRTSAADWHHNLAVNATGPFLCSRAVLADMRTRGAGRIVTIASTAGLEGGAYLAAYSASKHAVMGLMRSIAAEIAETGVTANTICPTFVHTDMTIATIRNIAAKTGTDLATAEQRLAALTPHGRLLEVNEVADAVMALIHSNHNGQEILLDGGDP